MCKKLKELRGLNPNAILHRYYLQNPTTNHVSAINILNIWQIKCDKISFEKLEKSLSLQGNDIILGMAFSKGDDLGILYSDSLDSKYVNYVIAHELAHCCLHLPPSADFHVELKMKDDIYSTNSSNFFKNIMARKKEDDADSFAAELLLPTHLLTKYFNEHRSFSIEDISNHFQVPDFLVHERIKMLS